MFLAEIRCSVEIAKFNMEYEPPQTRIGKRKSYVIHQHCPLVGDCFLPACFLPFFLVSFAGGLFFLTGAPAPLPEGVVLVLRVFTMAGAATMKRWCQYGQRR